MKYANFLTGLQHRDALQLQKRWFEETFQKENNAQELYKDDAFVTKWLENNKLMENRIQNLRDSYIKNQVQELAKENPSVALDGLLSILKTLPSEQKNSLLEKLKTL